MIGRQQLWRRRTGVIGHEVATERPVMPTCYTKM
jgi:hypothetical protein